MSALPEIRILGPFIPRHVVETALTNTNPIEIELSCSNIFLVIILFPSPLPFIIVIILFPSLLPFISNFNHWKWKYVLILLFTPHPVLFLFMCI